MIFETQEAQGLRGRGELDVAFRHPSPLADLSGSGKAALGSRRPSPGRHRNKVVIMNRELSTAHTPREPRQEWKTDCCTIVHGGCGSSVEGGAERWDSLSCFLLPKWKCIRCLDEPLPDKLPDQQHWVCGVLGRSSAVCWRAAWHGMRICTREGPDSLLLKDFLLW